MFIAIEGIDYSGKTTQIEALKTIYPDAVFTREPGGTKIGEKVRDIVLNDETNALTRLFLFLADRAEHIAKVIAPNENKLIITDRSVVSGVGYAWNDAPFETLKTLNTIASRNILPDLAIMLMIDETILRSRMAKQRQDVIEKQGIDFLLETQTRIRDAAQQLGIEMIPINAGAEPEKITEEIKGIIDDRRA
ncbi:thymidylate kinase [Campylobacterota bacterium]|nr:thymidylate kinase [Campylobacterota bacterium]